MNDASNINALWCNLVIEELIRLDIEYFCISPGSRSTPLTLAVANHKKTKSLICTDERGAAFHALGYARATGSPAALICTSGTAVANYYPAIVEASVDCVPVLILSADRPPELRETGANQTIRQPQLFGEYLRWHFDMPCPDPNAPPEMVLTTIDQAVYRTRRPPAGPVHLNFMFREPLAPVPTGQDFETYQLGIQAWTRSQAPFTDYSLPYSTIPDATLGKIADSAAKYMGLLVVGQLRTMEERQAVCDLAHKLAWPVFADITSGLRLALRDGLFIDCHDLMLASQILADDFRPQAILQIGGRLTSKWLLQFLKTLEPKMYALIDNHPFRHDPDHRITVRVEADISLACEMLKFMFLGSRPGKMAKKLMKENARIQNRLDSFFVPNGHINEPAIARIISQHLPADNGLFLASSMPVRDMNAFAASRSDTLSIAANRGASGIDGTIASAVGYAAGLQKPATLLIGDLAFLHDLNSLVLLRDLAQPVIIVVVNNNGGGIFSFLPIAGHTAHFEKYFGTPHDLSFEHAAKLFELAYENPVTLGAFTKSYTNALKASRNIIIEVKTDRQENVELHTALREYLKKERLRTRV